MRPKAIIALACLFAVFLGILLLGPGSYEKIEEIQTLENRIASIREQHPKVEHIGAFTLALLIDQGADVVLIDTRSEAEFRFSHLPGAVNLRTLDEIRSFLDPSDSSADLFVLYDTTGLKSAEWAEALQEDGLSGVRTLAGGIYSWAATTQPLVDAEGETSSKVLPGNRYENHLLDEKFRAEIGTPD